jgi:microcystin-dependent protein
MSGSTPNFSWILPSIGGDTDVWGSYTNTNWGSVDTLLRQAINCFASATAPTSAQHGTLWLDTTTDPNILKIYDGAAWAEIGLLNTTLHTFEASGAGGATVGDYKFGVQTGSHSGWLLCDGTAVSTTTYSGLFALTGYQFGGGGATFNLPDMRGRVPGAIGTGTGLSARTLGQTVGEETHTLLQAEIPDYSIQGSVCVGNNGGASVRSAVAGTGNSYYDVRSGGSGTPLNVMQPTLFVGNYFIYSGV